MVNYSLLGPSFKFPHLRYDELIGNGTISKEMQELYNQGHSWKYRDQNYTKHFLLSQLKNLSVFHLKITGIRCEYLCATLQPLCKFALEMIHIGPITSTIIVAVMHALLFLRTLIG